MAGIMGSAQLTTGDVVKQTFAFRLGDRNFILRNVDRRIEFCRKEDAGKPFGYIEFGGPSSGSIWLHNDCIGEYEIKGDKFTIIPIIEGRLALDRAEETDPVTYLLKAALSA